MIKMINKGIAPINKRKDENKNGGISLMAIFIVTHVYPQIRVTEIIPKKTLNMICSPFFHM
jgi:hypothetical protein